MWDGRADGVQLNHDLLVRRHLRRGQHRIQQGGSTQDTAGRVDTGYSREGQHMIQQGGSAHDTGEGQHMIQQGGSAHDTAGRVST